MRLKCNGKNDASIKSNIHRVIGRNNTIYELPQIETENSPKAAAYLLIFLHLHDEFNYENLVVHQCYILLSVCVDCCVDRISVVTFIPTEQMYISCASTYILG